MVVISGHVNHAFIRVGGVEGRGVDSTAAADTQFQINESRGSLASAALSRGLTRSKSKSLDVTAETSVGRTSRRVFVPVFEKSKPAASRTRKDMRSGIVRWRRCIRWPESVAMVGRIDRTRIL